MKTSAYSASILFARSFNGTGSEARAKFAKTMDANHAPKKTGRRISTPFIASKGRLHKNVQAHISVRNFEASSDTADRHIPHGKRASCLDGRQQGCPILVQKVHNEVLNFN